MQLEKVASCRKIRTHVTVLSNRRQADLHQPRIQLQRSIDTNQIFITGTTDTGQQQDIMILCHLRDIIKFADLQKQFGRRIQESMTFLTY